MNIVEVPVIEHREVIEQTPTCTDDDRSGDTVKDAREV